MKPISLFLFLAISLFIYSTEPIFATIDNGIVAKNIDVTNKVVFLDIPYSGMGFAIVWQTYAGKTGFQSFESVKGLNPYELRHHKDWNGMVRLVRVVKVYTRKGVVKEPSLLEEFDLFLSPEIITPRTVNFLQGHYFWGYKWNTILLLLLVISSAAIFFFSKKKTPLVVILFAGFLVSCLVMDMRSMRDHYYNNRHVNDNISFLQWFNSNTLANKIERNIVDKTWSEKGLNWPFKEILYYGLAKDKWLPNGSNPAADITISAQNGKIRLTPNQNP